jgi:propionate CoA-transferase
LEVADGLLAALAARYSEVGEPRDLTVVHAMGLGDNAARGLNRLAKPGLVTKLIGSHYGHNPDLARFIAGDKVQAFGVPAGVLVQLYREIAGHRPGVITKVGLGTYVDPRQDGGRLNSATVGSITEIVEVAESEWLLYRSFGIDVALIRATTADENGNLTMDDEAGLGDNLAVASAVHNCGGTVIAEVKWLARGGTLPARSVSVPGILVDVVVVKPDQWQTALENYSPFLSGQLRAPAAAIPVLPLDERKLIARRAALELLRLPSGAVCNLGYGISSGVASVLAEEGIYDRVVPTLEQGIIGGVPGTGLNSGTATNASAMIDEGAQFDLYDGGGLDVCCVSFGEVDEAGNVNVSRLGTQVAGPGGFINITQNAKQVIFCGTVRGGGMKVGVRGDRMTVVQEGRYPKFVKEVGQVTFSAARAIKDGRAITYVTERAVLRLTTNGLMMVEVASGLDVERDVLAHMEFRPRIAEVLSTTDARVYNKGPMQIAEDLVKGGRGESRGTR